MPRAAAVAASVRHTGLQQARAAEKRQQQYHRGAEDDTLTDESAGYWDDNNDDAVSCDSPSDAEPARHRRHHPRHHPRRQQQYAYPDQYAAFPGYPGYPAGYPGGFGVPPMWPSGYTMPVPPMPMPVASVHATPWDDVRGTQERRRRRRSSRSSNHVRKRGKAAGERLDVSTEQQGVVSKQLLDELVNQVLVEDLLPSLMMEALAQPTDFEPEPQQQRVPWQIAHEMVQDMVDEEARKLISFLLDDFVQTHLERARRDRPSPDETLRDDEIITPVVDTLTRGVIRETIAELVQEYLATSKMQEGLDGIVSEVLREAVQDVVEEAMREGLIEEHGDVICREVVDDVIAALARGTFAELEESIVEQRKQGERQHVEQAAEVVLDRAMLTTLLEAIGSSTRTIQIPGYIERSLGSVLADSMVARYLEINDSRARVQDSSVMQQVFREYTIEPMADILTFFLQAYSISEIEMLDEQEDAEDAENPRWIALAGAPSNQRDND